MKKATFMLNTCPRCGGEWPFLADACPQCAPQSHDELKVSLGLIALLVFLLAVAFWIRPS